MLLDSADSPNTSSNNSEFSFGGKIDIKMEPDLPPTSSQLPLLSPWSSFYANAGFPTTASASFPFPSPSGTNSFALAVGALGGDINAGWSEFTNGLTASPGPTPLPMPTTTAFGFGMGIANPGGYFQPSAMAAMSKAGMVGVRNTGLYSAMLSDERGSSSSGAGEKPVRTLSADGSIIDSGLENNGPSSRTSSSSGVSYGQKLSTGGPGADATSYFSSAASSPVNGGNIMQSQQQQQPQHPQPGAVPFDIAQRIISHPHISSLNPSPYQHQGQQQSSSSSSPTIINRTHSRSPPSQQESPSISPAVLNNNNQQPGSSTSTSFSFNAGQPPAWSHYNVHQQNQFASSSNINGGGMQMQRIQSISGSSVGGGYTGGQGGNGRRDSAWSHSGMEDDHSDHSHDHDHDSDVKPPKATRRRSSGRTSGSGAGGGRAPMVHSPGDMDDDDVEDDHEDFGGVGGEGIEKNGMMWGMKTADYKALNARERKRVRNRISARTFRARRKEHLNSLESTLGDKDSLIKMLQNENNDLKKRLAKLEGKPYDKPAGRR